MPYQATITWEDGHTTTENILSSVADELTNDDTHEFILWDDYTLTIEAVEFVLTGNDALDHCRLPLEAVRKLRDFLNSEHVTLLLS